MNKGLKDFGKVMDAEAQTVATLLMHVGRVTLTEFLMFSACQKSFKDQAEAMADMDACLKHMNMLPPADRVTPMMIHTALWKFSQKVMQRVDLSQ